MDAFTNLRALADVINAHRTPQPVMVDNAFAAISAAGG
jgi:hypothetical protein